MVDIIITICIVAYPAAIFIRNINLKLLALSVIDFLIFIFLKLKGMEVKQAFAFLAAALILNSIIYFIRPGTSAEINVKKTSKMQDVFIYLLNFVVVLLSTVFIVKTPVEPSAGKYATFEEMLITVFLILLFSYAGYFFIKDEEAEEND